MPSAKTKRAYKKLYHRKNADKLCSQSKEYHRLHANKRKLEKKLNTMIILRKEGQLHVLTLKSNTALTQPKRSLPHVLTRKSNTALTQTKRSLTHVLTRKNNTLLIQTKRSVTLKLDTKLILVLRKPVHVHTVQKTGIVYVLSDVTGMH